ncbi:MAG: hypothetical protein ACT6UH_11295 [Hydrogenophaga sp.]|uniref:hypothetical protein n=1 Tax=Hydrogenophaga sp. TaxID=1904254 RepID=UPI004035AB0B
MSGVFNAPQQLVYPASALMALNKEERRGCRAHCVEPGDAMKCEVPLNIGVFFDGTNNNAKRDEPERLHTNVVRLFNAHPDVKAAHHLERPGHYRIYVPGVGTPFDANAEVRESREGKAFGKGGQGALEHLRPRRGRAHEAREDHHHPALRPGGVGVCALLPG